MDAPETGPAHLLGMQVVLFADNKGPPALLRALAVNLKDWKMDFGLAFGSDAELKQRLSVRKARHAFDAVAQPAALCAG